MKIKRNKTRGTGTATCHACGYVRPKEYYYSFSAKQCDGEKEFLYLCRPCMKRLFKKLREMKSIKEEK